MSIRLRRSLAWSLAMLNNNRMITLAAAVVMVTAGLFLHEHFETVIS